MWLGLLNHHPLMRLVLGVHFAFFQGRVSFLALSIDTTLNTPFFRLTLVPIEAEWINSITPKGGGIFPRDLAACLAAPLLGSTTNSFKCLDFRNCFKWSLSLDTAWLCAPYPCDKSSINFDSFLLGHPPLFCSTIKSKVHSWVFDCGVVGALSLLVLGWKPLDRESFVYCGVVGALPLLCCWSSLVSYTSQNASKAVACFREAS